MEGNYTFKLTVVDVDGSSDAANGTVQVVKETDYPPEANAGAPVVVNLPQVSLLFLFFFFLVHEIVRGRDPLGYPPDYPRAAANSVLLLKVNHRSPF